MRIETTRGSLPIRYSWNALRLIGDELGLSMNDMLSFDLMNRKIGDTFTFVYFGFVEGARLNKEECKVESIEAVGDLLDEDSSILAKAIECFAEDMSSKKEGNETDKKK
jgi:hypothetical protein